MSLEGKKNRFTIAALVGALAAGSPAAKADDATELDSYTSHNDGSTYSEAYHETAPDVAVLEMLQGLDAKVQNPLSVTQQELADMRSTIDAYVAQAIAEATPTSAEQSGDTASGYDAGSVDPVVIYRGIEDAIARGPSFKNVALMGATLSYVKELRAQQMPQQ